MAVSMRRLAFTGVLLGALIAGRGLADPASARPTIFTDGGLTRGLTTRNIGPQAKKVAQAAKKWARFKVSVRTDKRVYHVGDLMNIRIYSSRNAYLMVYYINSQGKSSVICPSAFAHNNHILAGKPFLLRDNQGHLLKQYGPPGTETIQVVATEKPLDISKIVMAENGGKPVAKAKTKVVKKPAPAKKPVAKKKTGKDQEMASNDTGGGEQYDQYGNTQEGGKAQTDNGEVGAPTDIQQPQQFVNDTSGLIRALVRKKSTEIAQRHRSIGSAAAYAKKDSVYGLSSTSYRVVK